MYEFIDETDRFEVQGAYWDFLESEEENPKKAIMALKQMIEKDVYNSFGILSNQRRF